MDDDFLESGIRVEDEFGVTTIHGHPYGVISLLDLYNDIGQRVAVWAVAQAGEEGMTEADAVTMTQEALGWIAGALVDVYSDDDLRAVRVSRRERD